ncbi:MAG: L,D-transpeptidase family protein [Terracidiphilus sp.]
MKLNSRSQTFAGCICFTLCALSASAQAVGRRPLDSSLQMIVVTTPDWDSVPGHLQRFERTRPGEHWKPVGDPIAIVVGKKGAGWGAGLLPTDSPGLRSPDDPVKKEGDGKSPAGVFRISSAFGYAAQAPPAWKMPYLSLTPSVECVDDTASKFYNRIVDRATVAPDWHSSEHMSQAGIAYRSGAVIDHNINPTTPGVGSCVFLHIWAGPAMGTAGCTAMPQDQLEPILAWLDPADSPILVQLPITQYKKLTKSWHLPKLQELP